MRVYQLPDGNTAVFDSDAAAQAAHPGAVYLETRGEVTPVRLTKRAFWSRFPQANLVAMQAVLRSGAPALLAGQLGALQLLVSDSPFVDITLQQTSSSVLGLATAAYPQVITIDGQDLPMRLTAGQAAAILAMPVGDEIYRG